MKVFNYVIEASLCSLHSWKHFKLHDRKSHKHLVWGKLSVIFGQPHLEEVQVCIDCGEEARNIGEDGISFCEGCGICEGRTKIITVEEFEKGLN